MSRHGMKIRVLVVDDSQFFRRRVAEIINAHPELEVIGHAEDGEQAIQRVLELKPDIVTMDIEMPVLDGVSAVQRIMATRPTPIVMFSSLTVEGAQATLDALDAGAADFLPKRFDDIAKDKAEGKRLLCEKLVLLGRNGVTSRPINVPQVRTTLPPAIKPSAAPSSKSKPFAQSPASQSLPVVNTQPPTKSHDRKIRLIAIGTSTGGPVALQAILAQLPEQFPVPIIVVQHMPGSFTPAFAQRLDQLCNLRVKEAADGDVLKPGCAYIAPGGRQMTLNPRASVLTIKIAAGAAELNYKPSVDVTFKSVRDVVGGDVLSVILTGMGADGREGVRLLKEKGGEAWAQDEKSCVVYGMPAALVNAGLADRVYALADIAGHLVRKVT